MCGCFFYFLSGIISRLRSRHARPTATTMSLPMANVINPGFKIILYSAFRQGKKEKTKVKEREEKRKKTKLRSTNGKRRIWAKLFWISIESKFRLCRRMKLILKIALVHYLKRNRDGWKWCMWEGNENKQSMVSLFKDKICRIPRLEFKDELGAPLLHKLSSAFCKIPFHY